MSSKNVHVYLKIIGIVIIFSELFNLGTGFVTLVRGHHVEDEMDLLYLLNIVKIFAISGYISMQHCWKPTQDSHTCNMVVWISVAVINLGFIAGTIYGTEQEIARNMDDDSEENDYKIYLVGIIAIIQCILLASYTIFWIRFLSNIEINGHDEEESLMTHGSKKTSELLNSK